MTIIGKKVRLGLLCLWLLAAIAWRVAAADSPSILVLRLKGVINPVSAGYVERGIREANERGSEAAVLLLDTPGGLDTAMRDMVQSINASRVPVIVYVSPAGSRAASAGLFVTLASHVAAMAPDTSIGAAHPVGAQGAELEGSIGKKVTNDAAAFVRSLAERRGRNKEWAERAVRESVAASAKEALELGVIDLMATDLSSLLQALDGREVLVADERVTLHTREASVVHLDMSLIESFLFAIGDPNVAYILLSLGMLGLFLELSNPGAILPGVVGGICLLLGLYALGTLPVNWAGVLLIGLGFLLFLAEVLVVSHGLLAIGGMLSVGLGSLVLTSGSGAEFQVSRWVIAVTLLLLGALVTFVVVAVVGAHRRRPTTGREGLVGLRAQARTDLDPVGMVWLRGELWRAHSLSGVIRAGEEVTVNRVEGLKLEVSKEQTEESQRG